MPRAAQRFDRLPLLMFTMRPASWDLSCPAGHPTTRQKHTHRRPAGGLLPAACNSLTWSHLHLQARTSHGVSLSMQLLHTSPSPAQRPALAMCSFRDPPQPLVGTIPQQLQRIWKSAHAEALEMVGVRMLFALSSTRDATKDPGSPAKRCCQRALWFPPHAWGHPAP